MKPLCWVCLSVWALFAWICECFKIWKTYIYRVALWLAVADNASSWQHPTRCMFLSCQPATNPLFVLRPDAALVLLLSTYLWREIMVLNLKFGMVYAYFVVVGIHSATKQLPSLFDTESWLVVSMAVTVICSRLLLLLLLVMAGRQNKIHMWVAHHIWYLPQQHFLLAALWLVRHSNHHSIFGCTKHQIARKDVIMRQIASTFLDNAG